MARPYPFHYERWLRVAAAVGITAALAGCGASGNSSQSQSGTPTTGNSPVKPSVGQSGNGTGQSGLGNKQSLGVSPGTSGNALVPVPVTSGTVGKLSHASGGKLTSGTIGSLSSGAVGRQSNAAPGTASTGSTGSVSSGSNTSAPPPKSAPTKVKVIYKTRTVTRTVVRQVPPRIPSGAVLPSTYTVPWVSFTTSDGNIVCVMNYQGARCDIAHHSWTPPPKPSTCQQNWSPGILVGGKAKPEFLCSNKTILGSSTQGVLQPGYDALVGNARCEVRTFGVDCYINHHHGFLISRTGYFFY